MTNRVTVGSATLITMSRIEVSYGAPEHRWAVATISHEGCEVRMVVSCLTDVLRDLLHSLVRRELFAELMLLR
ncbi:hypothetical protein ACIBP6_44140 [Nonomuraea terrae]|uniref:hypothetical protein n=1 Tax=Nonomuraea terrae TaxID=2530383 RepID=UPI0037885C31